MNRLGVIVAGASEASRSATTCTRPSVSSHTAVLVLRRFHGKNKSGIYVFVYPEGSRGQTDVLMGASFVSKFLLLLLLQTNAHAKLQKESIAMPEIAVSWLLWRLWVVLCFC